MRGVGFSYHTHTRSAFQQPSFNSTGENKALYAHIRSRTPLKYCTATAVVVCTSIPMCLQRSDLTAAVDSPSRYDHRQGMIPSDVIGWFFLSNSLHSAEFILPNNFQSIPPAKTEDVPNYKISNKLPGYATIWYQERRYTPRRGV